ncbi:unnamed protein product [Rangifer tarandus platyrhynchus]|uniref:Uncharacterized protein n=1 Tax=Rangifer tarandus platyrhynchus TaxID=3082113 RepID=A0AC59YFH4_RANTA
MVVYSPFPKVSMLRPPSSAVCMPDAEGDTLRLSLVGTDAVAALWEQFLGMELPGLDDAHTLSLTQQSFVSKGLTCPWAPQNKPPPFLLTYQHSSSQLSHSGQFAGCQ